MHVWYLVWAISATSVPGLHPAAHASVMENQESCEATRYKMTHDLVASSRWSIWDVKAICVEK